MNGMNPDPMKSSALQDRVWCETCGKNPTILNPEKITGESGMLTITVECHGQRDTKMVEKSKLLRNVIFFPVPEGAQMVADDDDDE